MKHKWMTFVLITVLICGLLTGCGGGAEIDEGMAMAPSESFDKYGADLEMDYYESESMGFDSANGSGATASINRPYGDNVKLILRANLTLETTDFDDTASKLNQLVSQYDGYYEQSNVDMGSYYSDGYRYGRYTIRIPKDNYDKFLNEVGGVCHVTSRNESAEDIGLQYYDIESQIRLLEIKQERLMNLLKQASTMEDIITLENALSDIQYQLESHNSQKNRYDSLINYSTVEIRLEQVQRLSGEPLEQQGFLSQLISALSRGFLNAVDGFSDFLLGLAYNIVPLSIVMAVLIFFTKFLKKRKRNGLSGAKSEKPKRPWVRKKGETVGETKSETDTDFIPPSSEDLK